ncbi:hypothetical protein Tco_0233723 [Tanacetum coccineum]
MDVPSELPKVSLVNASLKKLKFHLTQFDSVVKKRTTPSALEEGEWGFEHTKAVFNNEIIPFLKSLKDIFNVFDKDLLNEITEFQNDESCVNQNAVEIQEYFEINDLKARLQDKDKTICKLKATIKSLRENTKEENVNPDKCDLEPINKELENSVANLLSENERLCNEINHVKQVFKDQFDSIKQTRVRHKEQSDSLINKLNLKSVENEDLKAQIQDKEIVEQAKAKQPLDNLSYTCPNAIKLNAKKVAVTPKNNVKKVRFVEPLTSSSNIKQKYMFDGVHDMCLLDFVENVNSSAKSAKKNKKQNIWKPTGHVFTEVGLKWKPIGRTFTIVGKPCPLTRITSANVVPPKKTTSHSVETQKPELKVYTRKPKNVKNVDIPSSSSLAMTSCPDFRFGNDHIARLVGYGDYQLGNVTISRVYYVERIGHNLFSIGQFCDADLEVAFWKNTCFIRNLEGVDLLSGSRDTNLYTISLDDMLKSSPICLLSKASKTKR